MQGRIRLDEEQGEGRGEGGRMYDCMGIARSLKHAESGHVSSAKVYLIANIRKRTNASSPTTELEDAASIGKARLGIPSTPFANHRFTPRQKDCTFNFTFSGNE